VAGAEKDPPKEIDHMESIRKRALCAAAVVGLSAGAHAAQFDIHILNLGPQPLSPVFFSTGNASFDIFTAGMPASEAIRMVAEEGDAGGLVAMADAGLLGGTVMDYSVASPGGPIMPGESAMVSLNAQMSHRWLSFASMLGVTNDAFIGSAVGLGDFQIDLFQGGSPLFGTFTLSFLNVWDAGTEVNTESAEHISALGAMPGAGPRENGVIHAPHFGILGIGDVPQGLNWYGGDVAQITIVPEPATLAALGLGALALVRRRKKV
jgi:hypothetical protein